MSGLGARNLNLNLNLNLAPGAGGTGGGSVRPRYNTKDFRKLLDLSKDLVPKASASGPPYYPTFHPHWDADLQSYSYLRIFVEKHPTWFADLKKLIEDSLTTASPLTLPQNMTQAQLTDQVKAILDLAPEREERFVEILDQHGGEGAINYWFGMLKIDPARHPNTHLMVRTARRVGEFVVMCLKDKFEAPRPSQLCPGIVPMIDPPATPAFPAGHALQSYLISYCLAYALPRLPQSRVLDESNAPLSAGNASGLLIDLAARVAENRVIAGLHFPVDNEAGRMVAIKCFELLQSVESFWIADASGNHLLDAVQKEFPQYK